MLVCNVSLRPPRTAIAANIAEATTAADATATGNVVFATLVDDPANVGDIVDAYSGEIMLEAASAIDVFDGLVPSVVVGALEEPATAVDVPSASIAVAYATLDGAVSNTTLSGDKLTATHSNTTSNSGARSTAVKTTGKFYFEATFNTTPLTGSPCGILRTDGTFTNLVGGSATCSVSFGSGIAYTNGSQFGLVSMGTIVAGDVVSYAIDLTNGKCWFRRNAGNWQGTGNGDPVAGTVGGTIASPGTGYAPAVGFASGGSGHNVTMNFGASAFAQTIPAGYTGWPI